MAVETNQCIIDECRGKPTCRGLCSTHYTEDLREKKVHNFKGIPEIAESLLFIKEEMEKRGFDIINLPQSMPGKWLKGCVTKLSDSEITLCVYLIRRVGPGLPDNYTDDEFIERSRLSYIHSLATDQRCALSFKADGPERELFPDTVVKRTAKNKERRLRKPPNKSVKESYPPCSYCSQPSSQGMGDHIIPVSYTSPVPVRSGVNFSGTVPSCVRCNSWVGSTLSAITLYDRRLVVLKKLISCLDPIPKFSDEEFLDFDHLIRLYICKGTVGQTKILKDITVSLLNLSAMDVFDADDLRPIIENALLN